ncbi:hypothetical protein Ciccas_002689 [Cichlidogyrus casuarinus]|uniref:Poly(A) RNA polymerase mitochondrial-like central palm domain-containing protein n=1 Tax=Cichlidogyrus casuarinus TaxID=1844966 RepID=A0ABD2QGK3_9PLAT
MKFGPCLEAAKRSAIFAIKPIHLSGLISRLEKNCGPLQTLYYWPHSSKHVSSVLVTCEDGTRLQHCLNSFPNYPRVRIPFTLRSSNGTDHSLSAFRICSDPTVFKRFDSECNSFEKLIGHYGHRFQPQSIRLTALKLNQELIQSCDSVDAQAKMLLDNLTITKADQISRLLFVDSLEHSLSELRPCTRVLPFGSAISGTGTPSSDLDLVVRLGPEPDPVFARLYENLHPKFKFDNFLSSLVSRNGTQSSKVLRHLRQLLNKLDPMGIQDSKLLGGRIPLLHVVHHRLLGIGIDISKFGKQGHEDLFVVQESATWQRKLMRTSPVILESLLLLKHILRSNNVLKLGPGLTFTSTKVMAVFIHFLQQAGYAPPIKYLLSYEISNLDQLNEEILDETFTMPKTLELKTPPSAVRVIEEFFDYVPTLDPSQVEISLLEGTVYPRKSRDMFCFDKTIDHKLTVHSPAECHFLYIPDPVRSDLNITHHIQPQHWRNFVESVCNFSQILKLNCLPSMRTHRDSAWGLAAVATACREKPLKYQPKKQRLN